MEGKYLIVSGPVIIVDKKLLVIKDQKDEFYKLPGGTVEKNESPEETTIREIKEEINGLIDIKEPIAPIILWEHPKTKEELTLVLLHYKATLLNIKEIKPIHPVKEVLWIKVSDLIANKYKIAPNIKCLIDKEIIN